MALHEDITAAMKTALKEKDKVRLQTIRSMMTAFTNELVATGRTPRESLSDEEVLVVIRRLAKQRRESITQYEAANRPELVKPEKAELVILESYLPQLLSQEEIRPIAHAKQIELGITDKSKMGMLVGAVMKELRGKVDGADVKAVVESLF